MITGDALSILSLPVTATKEEIVNAYRLATIKFHPDRNPAGLEMMKLVNVAYQHLCEIEYDGIPSGSVHVQSDYADLLNDALNAVIHFTDIQIEICGAWIWLHGNTKEHKEDIKKAGYFWSPNKSSWYFRPKEFKSFNRKGYSMDAIRTRYGSVVVNSKEREKLA